MKTILKLIPGILISAALAAFSKLCAGFIPMHLISAGVFAMLIGMLLHPIVAKASSSQAGIAFTGKKILKGAIVLMGASLSFAQVLHVGKYSLIVMTFTLAAAFGFGNLFGRLFRMNWKLSNLISAGTGICGGSAIAAIAPTIDAEDQDIAYAISATFLFDIVMVILFPIAGRAFGMSDLGYGLWAGTAVNDTSSVVAAGYAFSDAAGQFATIVKLTRTLSIVPVVLIFALVNEHTKAQQPAFSSQTGGSSCGRGNAGYQGGIRISKIFPWFILLFIGMVALRSLADFLAGAAGGSLLTPERISSAAGVLSSLSKFGMIMALGAIGLKTDFRKVAKSGFMPMLHGFIISALVVVVSFAVQYLLGQI